ncbi:hypothetical protein HMPREF9004_0530 [Schaalia cardiffensis F0333]|uniref:Uncharacterized protein n=1 Tax=Schaalia cardiffensis F0333 TaxID=888050 RepID=N6W8H6_9ACTO|nr:hypothetical protein HMPREF9004_0530 [Schaalia cardiffensis F0333]
MRENTWTLELADEGLFPSGIASKGCGRITVRRRFSRKYGFA